MAEEEKRASLAGEEALALWRQGKDAWNAWIDQNPKVDIDFSGVDFSKEGPARLPRTSFVGYRFGEGDVSFYMANFGDQDVAFSWSIFGNGDVSFEKVMFGNKRIQFHGTKFGIGDISFSDADFGDGDISFDQASFGKGTVYFHQSKFGDGNVSFSRTNFGDVDLSFYQASFGNGHVSFWYTNFGNGDVSFDMASFGDGNVLFSEASFGRGRFFLKPSESQKVSWQFADASFGGPVVINLTAGSTTVCTLGMSATRFDSSLYLKGNFGCVPDLRLSKLSHHVDFSTLGVTLRRKPGPGWRWLAWRAEDPDDGPRLRRLKEIAEGARDHEAALRFAALENRANRWIHMGRLASLLDLAFSVTSDYGRSIARPTAWLLGLLVLATGTLFWFSSPTLPSWNWGDQLDRAYDAVVLAATQAFAFLPPAKEVAATAGARLFGTDIPRWAGMLALGHSLASFVCLFLIGLGLRNRFRL